MYWQFLSFWAILALMGMTSLNVSMPRPLKKYIEAKVKEGGYSTPSEYIRDLVRDDQKRKAMENILIHPGMGSLRTFRLCLSR